MSEAPAYLSPAVLARARAPELWLLRLQRASRLPPAAFGVLCGLVLFGLEVVASFDPALPDRLRNDFYASGAFFGITVGAIAGILPWVFARSIADISALAPLLPGREDDVEQVLRAFTRLPTAYVVKMTLIAIAVGSAHAWLLGQMTLPAMSRTLQVLGTVLVWIGMVTAITPLIMNAVLVGRLGRMAQPDLFTPARIAPFGAIALRPALLVIGLQCAYPILILGGDQSIEAPTLIGIASSLLSMAGLFYLPLRGIRARLRAQRSEMLAGVDARLGTLPLLRTGIDAATDLDDLRQLEQLLALRERIAQASTWPLDIAGARRVLLYVIAPPLTWAAAALVEMAIDRSL